jgi:hypothetical protein
LVASNAFSQERVSTQTSGSQTEKREASSSTKSQTTTAATLPYDVNDKYMGRKAEFLYQMTVTELPSDFPVYEKQWGVKEYNAVVDAYYRNHMSLLKPYVQAKMKYQPKE